MIANSDMFQNVRNYATEHPPFIPFVRPSIFLQEHLVQFGLFPLFAQNSWPVGFPLVRVNREPGLDQHVPWKNPYSHNQKLHVFQPIPSSIPSNSTSFQNEHFRVKNENSNKSELEKSDLKTTRMNVGQRKSFMIEDILGNSAQNIVRPWFFDSLGQTDPSTESFKTGKESSNSEESLEPKKENFGDEDVDGSDPGLNQNFISASEDSNSQATESLTTGSQSDDCHVENQHGRQDMTSLENPLLALFSMTNRKLGGQLNEATAKRSQTNRRSGALRRRLPIKMAASRNHKTRTAFTNHQLSKLEEVFVTQKYVTPSERDAMAVGLGLSSSQIITWFQNRRAKLKREMEELKADVAAARRGTSLTSPESPTNTTEQTPIG